MLKNYIKLELQQNEKNYWKLYDFQQQEFQPFTQFNLYLINRYAKTTRERYTQVIAKFLDYLTEINFIGTIQTKKSTKNCLDDYLLLLSYGEQNQDQRLARLANILDIAPISANSWNNTIAALNLFLQKQADWAEEEQEYLAHKYGLQIPQEIAKTLFFLQTTKALAHQEIQALKNKSILANLARNVGKIEVNRLLKKPRQPKTEQEQNLDFPGHLIPILLSHTTTYRERALYSLMAGCGLRSSEALNLTWDCIDLAQQKIIINNPAVSQNLQSKDDIKFKGRDTSMTFFIPELKHVFFQSLYLYQKHEAVFPGKHNFVFQYLTGEKRGEPYYTIARNTFIQIFHNTIKRAAISAKYTPHSLRHFYGVYMLNYIPLQGRFGFSLEEVQRMMGHRSIIITQQYARKSLAHIEAQLELAHLSVDGKTFTIQDYNHLLAQKFLEQHQQLKELNNND